MGLIFLVVLAGVTLWTTVRSIRSGIASPIFQVIGAQEFERAEAPAFFWGIIGFNWLAAAGIAVLVVTWTL